MADTTNNRMELTAAIEGLRALKRASQVTVLTDSEYVRRGITEYLPRWKTNGWRTSTGKAVVNQDLWEDLEELSSYHEVAWIHVPGHSAQPNHERCDALATAAARTAKREAAWLDCRWQRRNNLNGLRNAQCPQESAGEQSAARAGASS
jgi:ribonuclease HI